MKHNKQHISISQFKSHCLEIISNLEKSQDSIIITKRNKPIATVSGLSSQVQSIFGIFKNQIEIKGDIVKPIEAEWEVEK